MKGKRKRTVSEREREREREREPSSSHQLELRAAAVVALGRLLAQEELEAAVVVEDAQDLLRVAVLTQATIQQHQQVELA